MADATEELYERRKQERGIKERLRLCIGSIARLNIEYLCETNDSVKKELSGYIKQSYNCLKNLEKELGIPRSILYTKIIDKRQVLIDEYESMQEECRLDFYSPQELLYSIKKRELIEKSLEALAVK